MTNPTKIFPEIEGDLLAGGTAKLPQYFKEGYSLITLVYEENGKFQNAQNQSSEWQTFWQSELKDKQIGFYELPMISKRKQWMSAMTNKWMRDGIPKNFHPNVITVYGEKENFSNLFGITNKNECFVILVKNRNEVITTFEGLPNDISKRSILKSIN
ncbi:MAG: hypothetical protein HC912_01555 [Saprospiraceae bacterium]|nr:hypothetical protein [Saprospiraceae bacterium]